MESTSVRTEWDAVVFNSKSRSYGASEWKSIEQRLPVTWTAGHLSGQTAVRGSSARPCDLKASVFQAGAFRFAEEPRRPPLS